MWRTMNSSEPSNAQMIARVAKSSCVRSRRRAMNLRTGLLFAGERQIARSEFIPCAVHGQKVARIGRLGFELLTQAEHVIVDRASGGIVLVSPYLVQQLLSRNHPIREICEIL